MCKSKMASGIERDGADKRIEEGKTSNSNIRLKPLYKNVLVLKPTMHCCLPLMCILCCS